MIESKYIVNKLLLDEMGDDLLKWGDSVSTIDGGDHLINIWINEDNKQVIMVQGTGDQITTLTER